MKKLYKLLFAFLAISFALVYTDNFQIWLFELVYEGNMDNAIHANDGYHVLSEVLMILAAMFTGASAMWLAGVFTNDVLFGDNDNHIMGSILLIAVLIPTLNGFMFPSDLSMMINLIIASILTFIFYVGFAYRRKPIEITPSVIMPGKRSK